MAKKKDETVPESDHAEVKLSAREARWAAFLEKVKAQNPIRYEVDAANGDFDQIPDSFE